MPGKPKRICVFMQTYSDNREELYRYHSNDTTMLTFLNAFDKVVFSFHNSPIPFWQKLLQYDFFKKIRNLQVIAYSNMTYPKTLQATLLKCYEEGFDTFVYLQDDVLYNMDGDIHELIHIIKNEPFKMLNLEVSAEELGASKLIAERGSTRVYDTTSADFGAAGMYRYDDGAYAADLEYLVTKVYPLGYFEQETVSSAENWLNMWTDKNPIERWTTNSKFFKRYNIVGGNSWNRANELILLNQRFNSPNL